MLLDWYSNLCDNRVPRKYEFPEDALVWPATQEKDKIMNILHLSLCMRKPTIWVSDQVRHKPDCTVTA